MAKVYSEKIQTLLLAVCDEVDREDTAVRERQLRKWKRLKLIWEGFQNVYYSEVAHDWRVYDYTSEDGGDNQSAYDKPINVFRAYLESIIAALSVTIPPVKCFPDDADNALDLSTAKAGDKIGELVYRHNDVSLLWLHALFVYCTEGMVAFHNHTKSNKDYGMNTVKNYEDSEEVHETLTCPMCNEEIVDELLTGEYDPDSDDIVNENVRANTGEQMCPSCQQMMEPQYAKKTLVITRLVGETREPKSRICMDAYGGLNVKIPNYARTQKDCPYLRLSREINYVQAIEEYPHLYDKIQPSTQTSSGVNDPYEQWARLNPQYYGEYPLNNVTKSHYWLRPDSFNWLKEEESKVLAKKFPFGVCVTKINDQYAEAYPENLDDHWTLTYNPTSDYLHHEPLGSTLVSVQEITNDLISLILQTIEHGIPQTFADPAVLNLNQYKQLEVTPGSITATKTGYGKNISDGFYEIRTATLSKETLPFAVKIQDLGQLASGALPSLFGGALQGTDTASEYAMSRTQALQRQANTYKMFVVAWRQVFSKVIPAYMDLVVEDERFVTRDSNGNFINNFIRKAELEGKIGQIEVEANENLPLSWNQKKDLLEKLMLSNNEEILAMLSSPENLPVLREALGLTNFYIPGEDDREKQYEEIKLLLGAEPIMGPMGEMPSVMIDPEVDNNEVQYNIVRIWAVSEAGRLAKTENPNGYRNVLLHGKMHIMEMQQQMMGAAENNGANPAKPNELENKEAPIEGEADVVLN